MSGISATWTAQELLLSCASEQPRGQGCVDSAISCTAAGCVTASKLLKYPVSISSSIKWDVDIYLLDLLGRLIDIYLPIYI